MESKLDWDKFTGDEEVSVMKPGGQEEKRGRSKLSGIKHFEETI